MKVIQGGITAPRGFIAGALRCGIKKREYDDLALLFSEASGICAGTFTVNKMRSGSVVLSEGRVKKGIAQAVIVNSGNANACAGKRELKDAEEITNLTAGKLNLRKDAVLIASTGIIGKPLPVGRIKHKIGFLIKDLKRANGRKFAKAIMTTDTVHKEIAVRMKIDGEWVRIGAAAKGSGMICPNMATMLAFFTTDASIDKGALRTAFKESVSKSFNRITVDGDMSTNDTAIVFANGMAGNKIIKKKSPQYSKFLSGLKFVSQFLAKKIVLDGEGATKFVEISVKGAKDAFQADKVARHVADSNLVKTMIAGGDPNWGRVAASIGSSGVSIKKNRVAVYFGKKLVMKNGAGTGIPRKALLDVFRKKEIQITIDIQLGNCSGSIWTCDFTEDYVRINAAYEA